MNKRPPGLALAAIIFGFVLLIASLLATNGISQASAPATAPLQAAGKPSAAHSAPALSQAPGIWATIAPFPSITPDVVPTPPAGNGPGHIKRAGAAAYPPNGKLYMLGGRNGPDGEDLSLRNVFEYTPGDPGTWVKKNALLDAAQSGSRYTANMAVSTLTGTNGIGIYAIGGNSIDSAPSDNVRFYDPVSDSVTLMTADAWPANPKRVPGGYAVLNNKLYIFGGFSALGAGGTFTDTWMFDPMAASGQKWSLLTNAPLSVSRGFIAGAALDGYLYAIGGDTWDASARQLVPSKVVERLDPTTPGATWQPMTDLPTARGDMGAWAYDSSTQYEISGRIAIAGGVYPVPDSTAYIYNPSLNSWNTFPALITATRNYGVAQLDGFLYTFGGYDYSNNTPNGANFNQRYDASVPRGTPTNTSTPTITPTGTLPTATPTRTVTRTSTSTQTPIASATSTPICGLAINEGFETGLGVFTSTVGTCAPGGCGWSSVTTAAHTGTHSAFAPDLGDISDQYLSLTNPVTVPASGGTMTFWHRYDLESSYDGGVLETSINGGTTWVDAGPNITSGGYNGTISSSFQSPISGRQAWTGTNGAAFTQVSVNLNPYSGQSLKIRFREANDSSVGATGWFVDDVQVSSAALCGTATGTVVRTSTSVATITRTSTSVASGTTTATRTSTAVVTGTSTAVATGTGTATSVATGTSIGTGTVVSTMTAVSTFTPAATNTAEPSSTSTTVPPTSCPIQFQDVASDNTFYPYVRCLACRGILGGYPCGGTGEPCGTTNNPYFRPGVQISRGQIAKIVSQSAGFNEAPGNQIYEDVPMASPFYDYINRLSNRGYIGGYPCGQLPSETCITPNNRPYFRPSSNATRGQISKIVATAAMITDPVSGQIYTDVGLDSPFYKWIQQLSARNVMSGYPCGGAGEPCDDQNRPYFRPSADVTRGQASKIVANTFFPDCQLR